MPSGEHLSTETMFRRHAQFVARFLFRLGVPASEVDDVVQEVFYVVHKNGGFTPTEAKPTTYLAAIAVRAASTHRRKRQRHAHEPEDAMASMAGRDDPQGAVEANESLAMVQSALESLDEGRRAVFVLYEIEGHSGEEIAAALDIAVGTVYSRLHKARKLFEKAMRRRMGGLT